jgi:hypothetical protein
MTITTLLKYTLKQLNNYPKIHNLSFNVILYYKQKNKFFLFITIIMFFLFFNPNLKTRFLFKTSQINILQITLRDEKTILAFINNFIYIYFPLIDSFTAEFKYLKNKNIIKFCFFKFPLLFELHTFFQSLEHLFFFLNTYKFQLTFHLKKQKNTSIYSNLLHIIKLPLLIKN